LSGADGTLAQLVEQRTFNPLVAGSNPARPTKSIMKVRYLFDSGLFHFWQRLAGCAGRNLWQNLVCGFLAQLVEQRTLNP
jgi:hypothetical protein